MTGELWQQAYGGLQLWQWLGLGATVSLATVLALVLERLMVAVGKRLAKLTVSKWAGQFVAAGNGPLRLPLWAGLLVLGARFLKLNAAADRLLDLVARSVVIVSVAWFLERFLVLAADYFEAKTSTVADAARARGVRTQLMVLRRILAIFIYLLGAALLLIQFDVVRNLGVSLLASAGLAGLVIGFAAQKSISGLLAGLQLLVTQTVRIGDSVLVEGEFGTVEEMSLTYLVVQTWDLRRVVMPISYFLDKPFQNWSRGGPGLLGTVTLEVDFTADVEVFRQELKRLLETEGAKLWDGKVQGLQVTAASDRTQTLRIVLSAADPGASWDLRCLIRERLVAFLARHPNWLPVARSEGRSRSEEETLRRMG